MLSDNEKENQDCNIIQVFAREVIEKVGELEHEKKKTEKAFHDFLPSCIVRDIKRKKVPSDKFKSLQIDFVFQGIS